MKLHLQVHGEGQALVFLHGFGFDHSIWYALLPFLQNHYQCYLVDLPGFGQSPAMDWLLFKEQLLSRLTKPATLIGWSLGGLYASRLAIEAPDSVLRLINVASSPYFVEEGDWPGISPCMLQQFLRELSADPTQTLNQFIRTQTHGKSDFIIQREPSLLSLQQAFDILKTWDLREGLKNFTKPTHYLFGKLDRIVPKKTYEVLQRLYPEVHCHLFNKAAHMPFLSHPELFLTYLQNCLELS